MIRCRLVIISIYLIVVAVKKHLVWFYLYYLKGFDEILKLNKKSSKSLFEGDIVQPKTRNAIQDKTKRRVKISLNQLTGYNWLGTAH